VATFDASFISKFVSKLIFNYIMDDYEPGAETINQKITKLALPYLTYYHAPQF